jgi:membrane-associated phospholipid phosphatase
MIDAGIWVTVLKLATARVRPNEPNANRFFQYGNAQASSFPSGHAMGAFSVASVFAEKYRDKKWVPWLSYGLATMVGASRLVVGRHYPGDVIVGAVLAQASVAVSSRGAERRIRTGVGPSCRSWAGWARRRRGLALFLEVKNHGSLPAPIRAAAEGCASAGSRGPV